MSPLVRHFILATAGHVDHGKSVLIKALTGTDPDRLPEEKSRGITIDLGFAHLELPAPAGAARLPSEPIAPIHLRIGIVDVPGHEDFVKNMVAGVGSIDAALLAVAADDGWMPQTEEHLQILQYLGVRRAVVAVTKIDLALKKEAAALAAIREQLRGSVFAHAPMIGVSAIAGHGLQELKLMIANLFAELPPPDDFGKPRLAVDRVFALKGIGTVVTGALSGGVLKRGQAIVVQPDGLDARIRSIQSFNRDLDEAQPGSRTALNVPDLPRKDQITPAGVSRGAVVALPKLGGASWLLGIQAERSERLGRLAAAGAKPLRQGQRVKLHLASAQLPARIFFYDRKELATGERAIGFLRCEKPAYAFLGDRFVLRDWSEQWTLAGGAVLDPDLAAECARRPEEREMLRQRQASFHELDRCIVSQLERDRVVARGQLLLKSRFSSVAIEQAAQRLHSSQRLVASGPWAIDAAHWNRLIDHAQNFIDAAHRAHPEHAGASLNELRAALAGALARPELFPILIEDLTRRGFRQSGNAIGRQSHRPELPESLRGPGKRLRDILSNKALDPPSRKELAPDAASQQALRFLLQSGEAVEVSAEIVLAADVFQNAAAAVREHLRQRHSATVSQLRQALGASRRVVVPLLEKLDRDGLTRREGDARVLRPD